MFRKVRNKKNEISIDAAKALLQTCRRGVLAVNGDDGYPYAVPVNFLYDEDSQTILFHGAKAGHKVDALRDSDKVCFTVFGNERVEQEDWAPYVQSAVVFGRCRLVSDREENKALVTRFAAKYYPSLQMAQQEAEASSKAVQMFEITIEHLSGKEIQEK